MKKRLLSVIFSLSLIFAFAQDKQVEGTITDAGDKSPVIGANVFVKGTKIGTATDVNGHFALGVPASAKTLTISYVGKKAQEVAVPENGILNIALDDDTREMNQVVVTALGVKREAKSLGYSSQLVSGANVSTAKEANVVNQLQGKVAGVQITGSSNLGGSSRILIRGAKSLTGNNQPLFVVDGVPLDNSNYATLDQARGALGYDYGNAAQDINSDDIESMNVLKGAAASALYGSRGANGVILVTTKRGTKQLGKGKMPIGVTVSQNVMFNQVSVLPEYQNKYGGGTLDTFRNSTKFPGNKRPQFSYDGSWGPKIENQPVMQYYAYYEYDSARYGVATPWAAHPNNVKSFFRTGVLSNTNVSMDGANENGNFRLSFSNLYQKGTIENSHINRSTVGFNGGYNFGKYIFSSIGVNYVKTEGKGRAQTGYENHMSNFTQWFQRQLDMEELRNYKNPDGTQRSWNRGSEGNPNPLYWDNPFWIVYENFETDQRDRVFGNVVLGAKPTDWLTIKGTVNADYYSDRRQERIAIGSVKASKYTEDNITFNENNYELMAMVHKIFKEKFDISGLIGVNRRDARRVWNTAETQGGLNVPEYYSLENAVDGIKVDNSSRRKVQNSVFFDASFGYAGMIFFNFTGRNDWSSTLPNSNNSYFYPSVALSFVYSELIKSNWFSYGKIRGNWSKVGNDTDPYQLETRPTSGQNFGSNANFVQPGSLKNPNLKPESIYGWEIGTEMALWQDRVRWDLSYYSSITKDNIFNVDQSGSTGYTSRFVNAGTVANSGIEFASTFKPVKLKGGFEWEIGFNIAKNWSKVTELYSDEAGNEVTSIQLEQAPFAVTLEARKDQPYGVIVGTDFQRDAQGNKLVDPTGFYIPTTEVKPLGSVLADFTGGVSTTLSWKGLSAYFLFDFQKGGHLFSLSNTWGKYSGTLKETAEGDIRENGVIVDGVTATQDPDGNWVSNGQKNTVSIAAVDHYFNNQGYVIAAADVYDASFVKFREFRLLYDIPSKYLGKTPIRGLTFGITGRNLAILKKNVPNIDPESAVSTSNVQGLEGGQLPTERSIGFNISIRF
ncbi:MAG: SusC/RagA family TonB-linked outer membrane protein [Bacteroidetes bacterium]|nr:SusC/RagA family TonB-linked outer membrane protein [Bacteroidota bacterium]